MYWVPAIIVALVLVAFGFWTQRPKARLERRVRHGTRTYAALVHLPPKLAAESLERAIAEKARRFPGRSRAWYVEQVVLDLKRDRR